MMTVSVNAGARSTDVDEEGFRALEASWNTQVLDVVCAQALEMVFELLGYPDETLALRVGDLLPVELRELNRRFRLAVLERKKRALKAFVAGAADLLLADLLRYPSV